MDDVIVAPNKLGELLGKIGELAAHHKVELAVWGHAGDANLHVFPVLDLGKLGDRQKVFKLMDDYFKVVIKMKGSIAGINSDGRLRSNYASLQLGEEITDVYSQLKKACDPHDILNPGVKSGTSLKQLVDMLGHDYTMANLADYLPRA